MLNVKKEEKKNEKHEENAEPKSISGQIFKQVGDHLRKHHHDAMHVGMKRENSWDLD